MIGRRLAALFAAAALFFPIAGAVAEDARRIHMIIVFPGGPEAEGGAALINQFVSHVASGAGPAAGTFTGAYFNDNAAAADFIGKNPDAFIMGSLGFYLTYRQKLNLVPLAGRKLAQGAADKFYVVARKGRYGSTADLKGKTLSGSVLLQDKRFINAVIFDGALDIAAYFKLLPTKQALSAVRKAAAGDIDAVLLDQVQYTALEKLALAKDVQIVYSSPPLPTLEFMMVDTPITAEIKAKMLASITSICDKAKGREICATFGLTGFAPVDQDALNETISRYDSAAH